MNPTGDRAGLFPLASLEPMADPWVLQGSGLDGAHLMALSSEA